MYDVIIVGAGPNGLSAAIALQSSGLSVLIMEASNIAGGGMRTQSFYKEKYFRDVCSSTFPLAQSSPFFEKFILKDDIEFIYPDVSVAHPLLSGDCGFLTNDISSSITEMGEDATNYYNFFSPLINHWDLIKQDLLNPASFPKSPYVYSKFAFKALRSINAIGNIFKTRKVRALWAGIAAHSMLDFSATGSSAIGLTLSILANKKGWPLVRSGAQSITKTMVKAFISLGGKIAYNEKISFFDQIPDSKVVLFDLDPKQVLEICDTKLSMCYKEKLKKFKSGNAVFKLDWVLTDPIPFKDKMCRQAGTVHLGGDFESIASSEQIIHTHNRISDTPYIILGQPSLFDFNRTPNNDHVAWGYCHVPFGDHRNYAEIIEKQVERYAPGFKDCVVTSISTSPKELELYNKNFRGGDINGGNNGIFQLLSRPVLKLNPYVTSNKFIYICSAFTPPGGGIHGMCGLNAAIRILKKHFPDLKNMLA